MSNSLVNSPGTFRPVMRLAMPVLVEQVLHLLVELVDLWITGHVLGQPAYLAAITLMVYMLWLLGMLFSFLAVGATALTARFVGAGDHALANRVTNQSMSVGLLWSLLLMVVLFPTTEWFISLMGYQGLAAAAAKEYFWIELAVLPALMVERVAIACLRGAGDTMSGLVVMTIVNVVNFTASYLLATGAGPLPALGWTGIALGTALSHLVGTAILLTLLSVGRAGYYLRWKLLWPDRDLIRRLLRIGIPGGVDSLAVVVCNLTYLSVITHLGDVAAAAHGVALQIEAIAYMPGGAFQIAAATLAGQYLGAQDPRRAMRSVLAACAVACVIMVASGVVFYIAALPLSRFFAGNAGDEVAQLAAQILRVVAIAMLPLAMTMVFSGALRGAGDTRWPMIITLLGMLAVRVPLALLFSQAQIAIPGTGIVITGFDLGVVGAWYGAVADIFVRGTLMTVRFLHGGWRTIKV